MNLLSQLYVLDLDDGDWAEELSDDGHGGLSHPLDLRRTLLGREQSPGHEVVGTQGEDPQDNLQTPFLLHNFSLIKKTPPLGTAY